MMLRKRTLGLLTGVCIMLSVGGAYAATQVVNANIKFLTNITFVVNQVPDFGEVIAGTAGTYTLDTADTVTATLGGVKEGGTTKSGNITIKGSAGQVINISTAGGYGIVGGVTPSAATCLYGAAVSGADCTFTGAAAPTNAGTVLKMGLKLAADGTQTDGTTVHPTVTLTVLYQ